MSGEVRFNADSLNFYKQEYGKAFKGYLKDKTNFSLRDKAREMSERVKEYEDIKKERETKFYQKNLKQSQSGEKVYYALTNYYTDSADQKNVKEAISKLKPDNVYAFLASYENKAEFHKKDHFFTQMITEYSFPEKKDLMRKVAQNLQEHCAQFDDIDICKTYSDRLSKVLAKKDFSKEDAKELDAIVHNIRFNEANDISARGMIPYNN